MLKIQKYITENGLEKTIKDFDLKMREYPSKILLKYNQLSPPTLFTNMEVQECRGIILEKGTWKVMSMAFTKFFNSGESNAHKIDWSTAQILEKVDGSLITVYWMKINKNGLLQLLVLLKVRVKLIIKWVPPSILYFGIL